MSEINSVAKELQSEWSHIKSEVFEKYNKELKENGELTAETKAMVEKADQRLDSLEDTINDLQAKSGLALGETAEQVERKGNDIITKMIRKGADSLTPDERSFYSQSVKALAPDSGPDGGFMLTPNYDLSIIKKIRELSPVRQAARVVSISSGNDYIMLRQNGDPASQQAGPRESVTDTTTPTYIQERIQVYERSASPAIAMQQLEDAAYDVEGDLMAQLEREFAVQEGADFIAGTGVNEPQGILTNSDVEVIDSGSDTAFDLDDLIDLQAELKIGYQGAWMWNKKTRAFIRKFAGNDTYHWEPSAGAGYPSTFLGDNYFLANDLVAPTSGAFSANDKPVLYGDFGVGYRIVDRVGMSVMRDPYRNRPFVEFYTRRRYGGKVVQPEAIKILRTAT